MWFQQVLAMLWRQYLWTIRNPMRSLFPMSIALIWFFLIKSYSSKTSGVDTQRSLSLDNTDEEFRIPIHIQGLLYFYILWGRISAFY